MKDRLDKHTSPEPVAQTRQSVAAEVRQLEEEFLMGYLCAVQVLAIAFNEDSLAENIIQESGFSMRRFLRAQKKTDFYTPKMNKIIRAAFRRA